MIARQLQITKWKLFKEFNNEEDLNQQFNRANWSIKKRHYLKCGTTITYRCRITKTCQSLIKIRFQSESERVTLYSNTTQHDHTRQINYNKFPKELVQEFVNLNNTMRPQNIQRAIYEKYDVLVDTKKISNYINRTRQKETSKSTNILDVIDFIKVHTVPQSNDSIIITNYQIQTDIFRVAFTSVNLLGYLNHSGDIATDGTYKLLWENYPVIVIGVNDMGRRFHPVLFLLTNRETKEDYIYAFNEMTVKFHLYYGIYPKITSIISDGSRTIASACQQFFGSTIRKRTCFFHVKQNIVKQMKQIKDKDLLKRINYDLYIIQLSSSDELFDTNIDMLFQKYRDHPTPVKIV